TAWGRRSAGGRSSPEGRRAGGPGERRTRSGKGGSWSSDGLLGLVLDVLGAGGGQGRFAAFEQPICGDQFLEGHRTDLQSGGIGLGAQDLVGRTGDGDRAQAAQGL